MRLLYAEDERSLARAVSAILDVMMPKLDGFEVLRRMRAADTATLAPVHEILVGI